MSMIPAVNECVQYYRHPIPYPPGIGIKNDSNRTPIRIKHNSAQTLIDCKYWVFHQEGFSATLIDP